MTVLSITFCLVFAGMLLFWASSYFRKRYYQAKEIGIFSFEEQRKTIQIHKEGWFSIVVLGGSNIDNLSIRILSANESKAVQIERNFPRNLYNTKGKVGLEFFDFYIHFPGSYTFEIENPDAVTVSKSSRSLFRMQEHLPAKERLSFLIKELSSPADCVIGNVLRGLSIGLFLLAVVSSLISLKILPEC